MIILGIDPGLSGAIAFYDTENTSFIVAEDMPVVDKNVNAAELSRRVQMMKPDVAIIELVAARPHQGVSSVFKFGVTYGMAQGVVAALGVPVALVTPGRWKKYFGLSSDKEKSRAAAIKLWPSSDAFSRKKDEARAEAALIAKYGAEVILRQGERAAA